MKYLKKFVKKILIFVIVYYLKFFSCFLGINFVTNFLSSSSLTFLFPYIISKFGAKVGDNVVIKNIIIDNPKRNFENLKIGSNVYIGKNVFFDLPDEIILEDDVVIAANVQFFTHGDVGNRLLSKYIKRQQGKIIVGKGSWIGAGSIILYGSIIEPLCIIAAGSVVKGHLESGWIYGGVPAKKIKKIWGEGEEDG